jgi:hypothetical protein
MVPWRTFRFAGSSFSGMHATAMKCYIHKEFIFEFCIVIPIAEKLTEADRKKERFSFRSYLVSLIL